MLKVALTCSWSIPLYWQFKSTNNDRHILHAWLHKVYRSPGMTREVLRVYVTRLSCQASVAQSGEYLFLNWKVLGSNSSWGTGGGLDTIIMWDVWPGWKLHLSYILVLRVKRDLSFPVSLFDISLPENSHTHWTYSLFWQKLRKVCSEKRKYIRFTPKWYTVHRIHLWTDHNWGRQ